MAKPGIYSFSNINQASVSGPGLGVGEVTTSKLGGDSAFSDYGQLAEIGDI